MDPESPYGFFSSASLGDNPLPDPAVADPLHLLQRYWGYDGFRPQQREIIESVLAGHDTIGLLPTGGGKSITFQIPALLLPGLTLVITPLISLMKDQVDALKRRGIRAECLHSGMSAAQKRLVIDKVDSGRLKILYLAPERLGSESFVAYARSWKISLMVVDEAHCISQWGYDFRPSYLAIRSAREELGWPPVLALTATATPLVIEDIARRLALTEHKVFALSFRRENLSFIVRHDEDKIGAMLTALRNVRGSAIVYVRSRKRTGELARELQRFGIDATFYHAGMNPEDKARNQDAWMEGRVRVIVATNAFGMGIDKADVRMVIHYDLPSTLEDYYQEAGRAGRDGLPAFAVVLVKHSDRAILARRLSDAFPDEKFIAEIYERVAVACNLAVGEGFNSVYTLYPEAIAQRFGYNLPHLRSALNLLSRAGYFEFHDDSHSRAQLMMSATRAELYDIRLPDDADRVLQAVLREYSGVFADYVPISETTLARRTGLDQERVYQALLLMGREGVISYIPMRVSPFVFWNISRVETRHVQLPKAVYKDRREALKRQLFSVIDFVFSPDAECRMNYLLEYFGETPERVCGRCDLCRSREYPEDSPEQSGVDFPTLIMKRIRELAAGAPDTEWIEMGDVLSYFVSRRAEVTEIIRELIDSGKLERSGLLIRPI